MEKHKDGHNTLSAEGSEVLVRIIPYPYHANYPQSDCLLPFAAAAG